MNWTIAALSPESRTRKTLGTGLFQHDALTQNSREKLQLSADKITGLSNVRRSHAILIGMRNPGLEPGQDNSH